MGKNELENVERYILTIIEKEKPETVEELAQYVKEKFGLSKDEAIRYVLSLESRGLIKLEEKPTRATQTLLGYLSSAKSLWYWITLTLTITTTIVVFAIPERAYPLAYIRHVLGLVFVLWLPGYSFIRALFPTRLPIKTGKKELDSIERVALSIGMSLAIVPLVGLLLNYTPWGITITPITLSLMALTIIFSTTAIIRECESKS